MDKARSPVLARLFGLAAMVATVGAVGIGSASAGTLTWNLTFTDSATAVSAILTSSSVIDASPAPTNGTAYGYNLSAISGTFGANNITGLASSGALVSGQVINDGKFTFDNIVYSSGPSFDAAYGLAFLVGGSEYNLYSNGSGGYIDKKFGGSADLVTGFSLVQVPEPASMALVGFSLLGIGLIRRRKAEKSASA